MLPFGDKTVTLYSRTITTDTVTGKSRAEWTREVHTGCSWLFERQAVTSDTDQIRTSTCVCRIPGRVHAEVGDVVVLGDVSDTIVNGRDAEQLVERYAQTGVIYVRNVRDNTAAPTTAHTALRG